MASSPATSLLSHPGHTHSLQDAVANNFYFTGAGRHFSCPGLAIRRACDCHLAVRVTPRFRYFLGVQSRPLAAFSLHPSKLTQTAWPESLQLRHSSRFEHRVLCRRRGLLKPEKLHHSVLPQRTACGSSAQLYIRRGVTPGCCMTVFFLNGWHHGCQHMFV